MNGFNVGDIVNFEYSLNVFIKSKIIRKCNYYKNYTIEIIDGNDIFFDGKKFITTEEFLKPIELNEIDKKEVFESKPINDFIYFKDIDIVVPKKKFQENILNIQSTPLKMDNKFVMGFSVFLGGNQMLKKFETNEQAQVFLKQLADLLGSDIL